MKSKTAELILNNIKSHAYCSDDWEEYSLNGLFDEYLRGEVWSSSDLTHGMGEFVECVLDNFDTMDKSELEGRNDVEKYSYLKSDLQSLTKDFLPLDTRNSLTHLDEQQKFAGIINSLTDPNAKILDVGCGKIPMSSILLAEARGGNVVAMDKSIILPEDVMERLGVESRKEMFNEDTNIKDVDLIVGNKPCSAIEPIVKMASERGLNYILKLCDCYAPNGSREGVENWQETLKAEDSRIKFDATKEYVTSLPVSEKMFDTIIDRINGGNAPKHACDITFDFDDMKEM